MKAKEIIPVFFAAFLALGCSLKLADEDRTISFESTSLNMKVGESFQIDPLIKGGTAHYDLSANPWNVKFTVDGPSVVTVSVTGLVKARSEGSAVIKITGDGVKTSQDISVTVLKNKVDLKVMSFNVKVDDLSGTETSWAYRRNGAVAMIKENAPDLLGLQEGQAHEITFLSRNLPDYKWYGLCRDSGKVPPETDSYAVEECMAIFYNTKVLKMEDCGTFWLSEHPDEISFGWDANYRRTCTWAKFTIIETGKTVFFFNTHLDNKGSIARRESIKLIVNRMKTLNPDGYPSYLTADFNSATTDGIFEPLRNVMQDARAEAPSTDNHNTFHNYESTGGKSTIDHVWFGGKGNSALKYHTVTEKYAGVTFVSDHYPVYGEFQVK